MVARRGENGWTYRAGRHVGFLAEGVELSGAEATLVAASEQ